jgi:hypothetical protein
LRGVVNNRPEGKERMTKEKILEIIRDELRDNISKQSIIGTTPDRGFFPDGYKLADYIGQVETLSIRLKNYSEMLKAL